MYLQQLRDELSKQKTDFYGRAGRPDIDTPSAAGGTSQRTVEILDSRVQHGADALTKDRHWRQAQEVLRHAKVVRVEVHLEEKSGNGKSVVVRRRRLCCLDFALELD